MNPKSLLLIILLFIPILSLRAQNQADIDSLEILLRGTVGVKRAEILLKLADIYKMRTNDKARQYAEQALKIAQDADDKVYIYSAVEIIGLTQYNEGKYPEAMISFKKDSLIARELNDKVKLSSSLSKIGVLYRNMGNYKLAIDYLQASLKLQEELNNPQAMGETLGNIGNIYFYFGENFDKALEYYQKSLEKFKLAKNIFGTGAILASIAKIYQNKKQNKEAIDYFNQALEKYTEINHQGGIADIKTNMGQVYRNLGKYDEALKLCMDALKINESIGFKKQVIFSLKEIGQIYDEWGKLNLALDYYKKAIDLTKEMQLQKELMDHYKDLSKLYEKLGFYQDALKSFQDYSNIKDSIFKDESLKQATEFDKKFQTKEKETQIQLLTKEGEKQSLIQKGLIVGSIFILLLLFLAYNRYLIKQKANIALAERNAEISQQKEEIEAQRDEIEKQRDIVMKQKQEITDSIMYASRIQRAILPPPDIMFEALPEHFVLNKPRNIVSGDFYWMLKRENKIIITVADCTGHGVPGAFMSMLGVSFLNEIANMPNITMANQILEHLRDYVINSLRQTGKDNEAKDGMDISLCIIDFDTMKVQYAGAYNSLLVVKNGQIDEVKADKMPIGIYFKGAKPFTNNEFEIHKGDLIYMFSDGYMDQFGGERGRKFMFSNFKTLLLNIWNKPMEDQKEAMESTIETWKGELEQVDDMLVIGIRL